MAQVSFFFCLIGCWIRTLSESATSSMNFNFVKFYKNSALKSYEILNLSTGKSLKGRQTLDSAKYFSFLVQQ